MVWRSRGGGGCKEERGKRERRERKRGQQDKQKRKEEIQCGHYFSRRYKSLRWNEMNAKPQCKNCNEVLKGNMKIYTEKLTKELSADFVETLKQWKNQTNEIFWKNQIYVLNVENLEMIIKYYREKTE